MNIAFFSSSFVFAYWNGAATYYRGVIRAMHERGHQVTFYEPDTYERQLLLKERAVSAPFFSPIQVGPSGWYFETFDDNPFL